MKKITSFALITSALMAPVLVSAATTAELKLTGRIIPAACIPNFVGGSTIDYGTIHVSTLNVTSQTMLPQKNTRMTITCEVPVKFALAGIDERAGTSEDTLTTVVGYGRGYKFGLGVASNGAKIGAYSLDMKNITADEGQTRSGVSSDGGVNWNTSVPAFSHGNIIGFSDSLKSQLPTAHKYISFDLNVVAAVVKSENLPIADEIQIDGLTTVEVKYL